MGTLAELAELIRTTEAADKKELPLLKLGILPAALSSAGGRTVVFTRATIPVRGELRGYVQASKLAPPLRLGEQR